MTRQSRFGQLLGHQSVRPIIGGRTELKPYQVDVLTAAPGPTDSGFAATVLLGFLSKLLENVMFGLPRWCRTMIMSKVMRGMANRKTT